MSFPVLTGFANPSFSQDPAPAYRSAHSSPGPGIFRMPNGDGLVITRYETLDVLKAHPAMQAQNREQRQAGSGAAGALAQISMMGPFFMNEPEHTPVAMAAYRPISPARNDPLSNEINAIANVAMDRLVEQGGGDLVRDYAADIASRFWLSFLNLPAMLQPQFEAWSASIVPMLRFETTEAEVAAANQAAQELWDFLSDHYAKTKSQAFESYFHFLAQGLMRSEVPGVPDDPTATIAAMTFDGIDSVTGATTNVLYTCLRHREQLETLRADPTLIRSAWREAMRLEPSLIGLRRSAREDVEYENVTLPKNVNIFMAWGAANRDPAQFAEPDRFDIHRKNTRFLTFGGGTRICKGRHLAQLQGEIALRVLLERTRSVELRLDEPQWSEPGAIRTLKTMPVTLTPH